MSKSLINLMSRRNLFFLACCPKLDFFFLEKAIFQPLLFQNIFKPQFTCGREQIIEKKYIYWSRLLKKEKHQKKFEWIFFKKKFWSIVLHYRKASLKLSYHHLATSKDYSNSMAHVEEWTLLVKFVTFENNKKKFCIQELQFTHSVRHNLLYL